MEVVFVSSGSQEPPGGESGYNVGFPSSTLGSSLEDGGHGQVGGEVGKCSPAEDNQKGRLVGRSHGLV